MRSTIKRLHQSALAVRLYILAAVLPGAVFWFTQWLGTWSAPITFSLYLAAIVIGAYVGGRSAGVFGTALAMVFLVWHYGFASSGKQIANLGDLFPVLLPFAVTSILASHVASTSRQSVNLFANIHDTIVEMAEAVILADQRGRVAFLNKAAQKLVGWSQDDAYKKPIETVLRLLDDTSHQPLPHPATLLLKGEKPPPRDSTGFLVAKDGSERLVEYTAEPLKDANRVVTGVLLFFDDASQRRGVEQELRQREAQFRAMTAAAPAAIMALDATGECSFCNTACQMVLGFAPKEGLGSGWTRFIHPDDQAVVEQWKAAARQGSPLLKECRFQDGANQVRWVRVRADAARLERGQYLGHVAVLEDLTPQKGLERQLAEHGKSEEALRASFQEREAQFNKRIAALDETRTRLEKQLAEHDETADAILSDHEQRQSDSRQVEAKLRQDMAAVAESHRKEMERMSADRKQLEERLQQPQQQKPAADPRLANLDAAHKQLQEQLAGHEKAMEELLEEHTQKQSEWQQTEAKLRQDLAATTRTHQQHQRQLTESQERENRLRQELDALRAQHAQAIEHGQNSEQSWQQRLQERDQEHARKRSESEQAVWDWQKRAHAQEQSGKRVQFLADAGQTFAESLDYAALLQKIPAAAIPMLGNACAVFVGRADRSPVAVALGAEQGANSVRVWNSSELASTRSAEWGEVAQLLRAAKPALFETAPAALRSELAQLPAFTGGIRQVGSAIGIPLHVDGETEGFVIFCRDRELANYTPGDLELAEAFIRRATLVLTHARRHDAIRSAHADLALQHDAVSTAHEQMKQECERLRAVLAGLDEGICVLDKSGAVLSVNSAGCTLLGWPHGRERVERIDDLLHDASDDLAFLKSPSQLVQTLAATTALRRDRALLRKSDGDALAVSCVIAPLVLHEEISGAVIAFRSVNVPSKIAAETQSRTGASRRGTDELVAGIADCGRPLIQEAWKAFATLKEDLAAGSDPTEHSELLERQMQRLSRHLHRLSTAIRVAEHSLALVKHPIDINLVVDRAVESVQPLVHEHQHHLTVALPLFPECVWADEDCFEQALEILLENAALMTRRGGQIRLSVEHHADEIWLRVKDNGRSAAPHAIPDVTRALDQERNSETDAPADLGVALARSLIEAHGGTLSVIGTTPDQGSELVLRWPAIVELAPVEMATVSSNGHHAADSDDEFALPLS